MIQNYTGLQRGKKTGDLCKLCEWSKNWQLKLNINKCKIMHVGSNKGEIENNYQRREKEQILKKLLKRDTRVYLYKMVSDQE